MIQSTRGCPYQCAFCWEGGSYFQKVKRFKQTRVTEELAVHLRARREGSRPVHRRRQLRAVPRRDMETAREIHSIQHTHANRWPRTILAATAKNNKERTIEIVELLKETLPPTGAVKAPTRRS